MGLLKNIRSAFGTSPRATGDHADMPCRDIVEIATSYLEGDLDPALRARFDAHLAKCPDCVMYVEQMRETIELTGSTAESQELPAELRAHLQRVFEDWSRADSVR